MWRLWLKTRTRCDSYCRFPRILDAWDFSPGNMNLPRILTTGSHSRAAIDYISQHMPTNLLCQSVHTSRALDQICAHSCHRVHKTTSIFSPIPLYHRRRVCTTDQSCSYFAPHSFSSPLCEQQRLPSRSHRSSPSFLSP